MVSAAPATRGPYRSISRLDPFRTYYGPTQKAFAVLSSAQQESLAADLIRLVQQFNRATDGAMVVPREYLEVVIRTR